MHRVDRFVQCFRRPAARSAAWPAARPGPQTARSCLIIPDAGLSRVAVDGGTPTPLTHVNRERGEIGHNSPTVLPDGRHLFYVAAPSGSLWFTSLDAFKPTLILPGPVSKAIYVPPGWLLFARQGTLLTGLRSGNRDPQRRGGAAGGSGWPVNVSASAGDAAFGASSNGALVYRTGASSVLSQLTWADSNGKRRRRWTTRLLSQPGVIAGRHEDCGRSTRSAVWNAGHPCGESCSWWCHDPLHVRPSQLRVPDLVAGWAADPFGSDRDRRNRSG